MFAEGEIDQSGGKLDRKWTRTNPNGLYPILQHGHDGHRRWSPDQKNTDMMSPLEAVWNVFALF